MSTYFLLLEAVRSEDLCFLEVIFNDGRNDETDINDADEDGITCLHIAAGLENCAILECLLDHGAIVNSQTSEGLTPLHIAAMWGRGEQVSTLLSHGADCLLVDANGCNALMHAVNSDEDGSQSCVDLISSHQDYSSDQQESFLYNAKPEIDFDRLNGSPWVTPRRRRLKASRRNRVNKEERLESVQTSSNSTENFEYCEELLTELSSGLSSSSGQDSPTNSNSTSSVQCSECRTLYGSSMLTECSTLNDLNSEEKEADDEMRRDVCGNVKGNMQENIMEMELKDKSDVTDEDTCAYVTADEEIGESLKKGIQIGNDDNDREKRNKWGNSEEVMKENIQDMKEENQEVECVNQFGEGYVNGVDQCRKDMEKNKENGEMNNKGNSTVNLGSRGMKDVDGQKGNIICVKERNNNKREGNERHIEEKMENKHKDDDLKEFEDQKRNDGEIDTPKEVKGQNKDCFNIDNNDFTNVSIIDHFNSKPTNDESGHLNASFNSNLNKSGLPFNSTFCVDSPLNNRPKQPSNFFVPFQSDKPSVPKMNPSAKASNVRRNVDEETVIYDWREFSVDQRNETMARIPVSYKKISCHELRNKIKDHGQIPGPITPQTKMLYVKKLWRLDQGIGKRNAKDSSSCSHYPVEVRLILTGRNEIPDCGTLEQDMIKEFCKSPRKVQWRGGTEKSSFNYLLLDPRVTLDLPQRNKTLSLTEAFRCFILSVFYIGKGKRSRPYAHLHEAIKYSKSKANQKLDQIWDIWKDGLGVISLHLFQSAIPVEAFTREACMVEALGLSQLTNQKRGEYYGLCASLDISKKRKLGIYLLYKAFQIFLQEGERQICKEDL